jgi:hypothetical protein
VNKILDSSRLLLQKKKKKDTDQEVMKSAALGTIHTYPKHDWLHVHTDDSLTEKNGNAEGTHCKLFSFYVILG